MSFAVSVSTTPPETRFEHHGAPAETRDAWIARRAAEAAAQARSAELAHRQNILAAQAQAKDEAARRAASAHPRPVRRETPVSSPASDRSARRLLWVAIVGGMAVLVLTGLFHLRAEQALFSEPTPARAAQSVEPAIHVRPGATPLLSSPYGGSWTSGPNIDPSPQGWWCICYKTNLGRDHTACRRLPGACEELRAMIQTSGSGAIRRGSASEGACRHVQGHYPWTRLGHHAAWVVSAYSDAPADATPEQRDRRRAAQAVGVCAL